MSGRRLHDLHARTCGHAATAKCLRHAPPDALAGIKILEAHRGRRSRHEPVSNFSTTGPARMPDSPVASPLRPLVIRRRRLLPIVQAGMGVGISKPEDIVELSAQVCWQRTDSTTLAK